MNPETLIVIRCHSGDKFRLTAHLPMWKHHGCPILLLSPEDSPVVIEDPQVIDCRHFGKSEYGGKDTISREHGYLATAAEYDYRFTFVCDTDCYSLDPEFPACLYESENCFWSAMEDDTAFPRPEVYPFPRWSFQTPWFVPRAVIPRLLKEASRTMFVPQAPWGDNYVMQLTVLAGIDYKNIPNSISCCINEAVPDHLKRGEDFVRNQGGVFVHSVKDLKITQRLIEFRKLYLQEHPK